MALAGEHRKLFVVEGNDARQYLESGEPGVFIALCA